MENCQQFRGLLDEDDSQTQKQLDEQLGANQQAVSNRLREMGKTRSEDLMSWRQENKKNAKHMWHVARSIQKNSYLQRIVTGDEKWIVFGNPKRKKIMGRPRRTIHIDRKTESLWQKDDALLLMGSEGRVLLRAVKSWGNG